MKAPDRRVAFLVGISIAAIWAVLLHGPIAQDPTYHAFADQRAFFGVPNFWNVASNLPFVLVGIAGLVALRGRHSGLTRETKPLYAVTFVGLILIALGSGYYHWNPTDATLVWDRLPMTISFMGFFAIVLGEHVDPKLARRALPWLLAIGFTSVLYWVLSDGLGRSDLRPYLVVQFLPMILIPAIVLLFPRRADTPLLWALLVCYAAAKVFEAFDASVYRTLGFVSGHTLKHLLAAGGMALLVVRVVRMRTSARDSLQRVA